LGCQGLEAAPPLAIGSAGVTTLASDGDHVYWTTADGNVQRVSVLGGDVEHVARGIGQAQYIALDAEAVYFATNGGQTGRGPIGLGWQGWEAAPPLAIGSAGVTTLASDGDHVYWTTADGNVQRVSVLGGDVEHVARGIGQAQYIALDAEAVYFATNGGQIGSV